MYIQDVLNGSVVLGDSDTHRGRWRAVFFLIEIHSRLATRCVETFPTFRVHRPGGFSPQPRSAATDEYGLGRVKSVFPVRRKSLRWRRARDGRRDGESGGRPWTSGAVERRRVDRSVDVSTRVGKRRTRAHEPRYTRERRTATAVRFGGPYGSSATTGCTRG